MTSRPLLTRVAELIVMTGPMSQVGCARASLGGDVASSARGRPRNGPPLAVTPACAPRRGAPPRRPGRAPSARSRPARSGRARPRALTSGPPTISDSLLASASVRPASQRGEGRAEADGAGDAVEHGVARPRRRARWRRPGRPGSRAACRRRPAPRAAQRRAAAAAASSSATATVRTPSRAACSASSATRPPPAASADDPEPVGVAQHDVDGLGADRAGAAQQDHLTRPTWPVGGHGHRARPDVLGLQVLLDALGAALAPEAGLALTPPNGAAGLETTPWLMPTMPVSSRSRP